MAGSWVKGQASPARQPRICNVPCQLNTFNILVVLSNPGELGSKELIATPTRASHGEGERGNDDNKYNHRKPEDGKVSWDVWPGSLKHYRTLCQNNDMASASRVVAPSLVDEAEELPAQRSRG